MKPRAKFLIAFTVLIFSSIIYPQQVNDPASSIKKENLIKTVKFLSGKELGGRLPGDLGYTKAAEFIRRELKKLDLKPFGENYFQKLKVEYNQILAPEHFVVINNGKKINYKLGDDYVYRGFTGAGKLNSNVVFCGYGLSQPELIYDDYAGVDVKGKIVLAFKYNPKWNVDGKNFTNGNPREKAIAAAAHGAVGILFVSFPNDAEPQRPIGSVIAGAGEQLKNFPEVHIDLPVADKIFEESGTTLKELQTKIDNEKKPASIAFSEKVKVDVEVNTKYEKEKEVMNVVGILEGSDPVLKNEYLIIGAHLDHVGSQAGKIYFPGANDNASGSAALLEIARAFASLKEKPKRSIVFAFFASEEQGLYGAKFLSENLPAPKEKIKVMINMDCIGYGDSIQVGGGKTFENFWQIAKKLDSGNEKLMVNSTGGGGGADAEPFFQKGIPTLYFVTTNSYKHLHMLSDKVETLNPKLFEAITKLAFRTAQSISNM